MYVFVVILYVLVCSFLIFVVLLQQGRGGMGSAFGGSSQTVFGGAGAGNVLTRITSVCAALFMLLSALLAYMSSSRDSTLEQVARELERRHEPDAVRPEGEQENDRAGNRTSATTNAEGSGETSPGEEAARPEQPAPMEGAVPTDEAAPAEGEPPTPATGSSQETAPPAGSSSSQETAPLADPAADEEGALTQNSRSRKASARPSARAP
jgi:preprotein translocase subunit SecG